MQVMVLQSRQVTRSETSVVVVVAERLASALAGEFGIAAVAVGLAVHVWGCYP